MLIYYRVIHITYYMNAYYSKIFRFIRQILNIYNIVKNISLIIYREVFEYFQLFDIGIIIIYYFYVLSIRFTWDTVDGVGVIVYPYAAQHGLKYGIYNPW